MPRMASKPVAAVALRSPIKLFEILNVVPVVKFNPLVMVPVWLPERS